MHPHYKHHALGTGGMHASSRVGPSRGKLREVHSNVGHVVDRRKRDNTLPVTALSVTASARLTSGSGAGANTAPGRQSSVKSGSETFLAVRMQTACELIRSRIERVAGCHSSIQHGPSGPAEPVRGRTRHASVVVRAFIERDL